MDCLDSGTLFYAVNGVGIKADHECCFVDVYCRMNKEESLINSHIYVPQCLTSDCVLPALCNCVEDNGCERLRIGQPTRGVVFDTAYTFVCANATSRYASIIES